MSIYTQATDPSLLTPGELAERSEEVRDVIAAAEERVNSIPVGEEIDFEAVLYGEEQ